MGPLNVLVLVRGRCEANRMVTELTWSTLGAGVAPATLTAPAQMKTTGSVHRVHSPQLLCLSLLDVFRFSLSSLALALVHLCC